MWQVATRGQVRRNQQQESHLVFGFFRRLFSKKSKDHIISSIFYYNEYGELDMEVILFCSCQDPVNILKMDDSYENPIPHFECLHCDRGCKINNCGLCEVYSRMANARDLATE